MRKIKKVFASFGLNEFFLACYTAFILSSVFTLQMIPQLNDTLALPFLTAVFLCIFIPASALAHPLLKAAGRLSLKKETVPCLIRSETVFFFTCFSVSMCALSAWCLMYYPGWFSGDSLNQLSQAMSGSYNDWHPVLQTLITFTIPLKLTGGQRGSVIIFQALLFSIVCAYMCTCFFRYGSRKYAIFALIITVFNPLTGGMIKQPWKDVTFAIFAMLTLSYALNIFFSRDWRTKPLNLVFTSAALVTAAIVRHNAIIFALPVFFAIFIKLSRKEKTMFSLFCVLLYAAIKGPLYTVLGVTSAGSRSIELLGLPLTVIGNVVKNAPDKLSTEILDFAYAMAPADAWQNYITGNFNALKFMDCFNSDPVNAAGISAVIGYMFQCFAASPKYALEGLLSLTSMVYAVTSPISWDTGIFTDAVFALVNNSFLKYISLYIGIPTLAAIIITLGKCRLTDKIDAFKILICLSMLLYNWGTMLLLTGPDFRFFFYTFQCTLIIIFVMINDTGTSR